jgi:hypothetical protein
MTPEPTKDERRRALAFVLLTIAGAKPNPKMLRSKPKRKAKA